MLAFLGVYPSPVEKSENKSTRKCFFRKGPDPTKIAEDFPPKKVGRF